MEDIELVVKIPENTYRQIQALVRNGYFEHDICGNSMRRIANGTPLPKGHGKLIDAGIIKDFKNKIKHYGKDYMFTQEEILNILERYEIKYAPTIIEADTESRC